MTPEESILWKFPWSTFGRQELPEQFFKKVQEQAQRVSLFKKAPLISVVVTVPDTTDLASLRQCLESLVLQSYSKWEAIVVGARLEKWKGALQLPFDKRIRWCEQSLAVSEVEMKNIGALPTEGKWLAFLSSTSVLSPAALYDFVLASQEAADELIYSHEVEMDKSAQKIKSFISRPQYSWFNLLHFNYLGDFWMVKRSLFEAVGGFEAQLGRQANQVFLLKLSELGERWHLVPSYLHYSRESKEAESTLPSTAPIEAHLARKEITATVCLREGKLRILPEIVKTDSPKRISAVICFRDKADWTVKCIKHLKEQMAQLPLEILLVNNNSEPSELAKVKSAIQDDLVPARIIDYDGPFNFGHMHNLAIRKYAKGEFLLLLNNDVFWAGRQQLDELASWAQFDWVGTVGFLLRYQHGGVQHSGFSARFGGEARLARLGNAQQADRFVTENHEVFGNTFAACMMKRSTFDQMGGFRELDIPNGFGDVAFNFDCLRKGLKNLYLGQIEAVHLESASRGLSYEYWEECTIEREYPEILEKMLRCDLGVNRVPQGDYEVLGFLKEALLAQLRVRAPWLKPLKDSVRKLNQSLRFRILRQS